MKKAFAIFLVILVTMMSASFAEDLSSISSEELIERMDSIKTELISRQFEEDGRILVADELGVKIYFDGFSKDVMDDEFIRFIILNNSKEELPMVVSIDELYIDGWDVLSNGYLQTLAPGKNGVGEAWMKWEKCITANEETASKIDVKFEFQLDKGNYEWEDLHKTELITFFINK